MQGAMQSPVPSMHDWLVSNYARIQERKIPSKSIGKSQDQSSAAMVTKKNLDQEISAQPLGQIRDIEEQNPGIDFGR